ncbi:MAG: C-GCAxxG-C-C family protein, partial [Candidatus Thorarchaeota archaeon]
HNCSQSIFCSFSSLFGLDYNMAFKIASAFGGGMGRIGNTCGAVTGALMIIGLYNRNMDLEDNENKERTYELVRLFINRFKELHSSVICRELIDCDINTSEGLEEASKKNVFENVCFNLVKSSALILTDIINKEG